MLSPIICFIQHWNEDGWDGSPAMIITSGPLARLRSVC
jgi:hypothetical protein